MITPILQKQLEKQLEVVYFNIESFIIEFFTPETLELLYDDNLDLFLAYTHDSMYVQCHWIDDEGDCVSETQIDYEDYNQWYQEVTDGV